MKKLIISLFIIIFVTNSTYGEEQDYNADNLFHIGQMNSYDENFSLYFKTREKSILARGENFNYVTDFPQDLYIYNYKTKTSTSLISYEWFPSQAKFFLEGYDFPVFPEDFAYYLLKDNNTLIMISAIKNINKNFQFDIINKRLNEYPSSGKFEFIISSIAKNCGHSQLKENYKCNYYKPLISSNLIN
ncbi:MAG: hypothetical protein HQ480_02480 [Candidatus Pelagibacter sp.]|nr:hypothetical protein [Candidatus Pelagibacter sp.]